jgi:hypothetical protein
MATNTGRLSKIILSGLAIVSMALPVSFEALSHADDVKEDAGRIVLSADKAKVRAERFGIEKGDRFLKGSIKPADSVDWAFRVERAGWYQVIVHYALPADPLKGKAQWEAKVGDQTRLGPIHSTGAGDRFLPQVLFDPIELGQGEHNLTLATRGNRPVDDVRIVKVELVRAREPGRP